MKKYELTTRRAEWGKAFLVATLIAILYAQFLFFAHHNFFLVKSSDVAERVQAEELYWEQASHQMNNPQED